MDTTPRPHRWWTRPAALLLALATMVVLAGCGGGRDALTIYSGRGENLVGPLLERFSKDTGIPIDVRYGDSADLALLLAEEGDKTPADVFLSQSPGAVGFLAERNLLAPLDRAVLDLVDARFANASGLWVGVTGRQRVLVYNSETVQERDLPRSITEITDPRFRGRVGVAPENASFQDFVTVMRLVNGDEQTLAWLKGLVANEAKIYPNNNAIVSAVARGEVPMGLVNHYYNFRFLDEDPSVPTRNFIFPDGDLGSLMIVSSVSVLAASDDDERARRFVEYLLSASAQRYFSDETFEYPLAAGAQPSADLPPLEGQTLPSFDLDRLGGGLERTTELIAESGLTG